MFLIYVFKGVLGGRGYYKNVFKPRAPHSSNYFNKSSLERRNCYFTFFPIFIYLVFYINMVIVSRNSPLISKALQTVQLMVVKVHQLVRVQKIFRTDNDFRVVVLIQDQWAKVLPDHCALKFGFTWYRVLYR